MNRTWRVVVVRAATSGMRGSRASRVARRAAGCCSISAHMLVVGASGVVTGGPFLVDSVAGQPGGLGPQALGPLGGAEPGQVGAGAGGDPAQVGPADQVGRDASGGGYRVGPGDPHADPGAPS